MPAGLSVLARNQAGVVSRKQALAVGMSRSAIRSRVVAGRWQQVHHGVYATSGGVLTRHAQLWAAVLYAGNDAALSHETAAKLHGLTESRNSLIHVTVPLERQVRAVSGLVVHRSGRYAGKSLSTPPGELPRTGVEETILDLAEGMDSIDEVCALVTRAFARNRAGAEFLRAELEQRERQKWKAELSELVVAAEGGAHSVLEFRYDRDVEKAHGLPVSRHQVSFAKKDGSRGYRDRVYEKCKVIIELDGALGHSREEQWADKGRDNAAAAGGRQSLRYGWQDVRWHPCETAAQIAEVLRGRGWEGTPKPCARGCALDAAA